MLSNSKPFILLHSYHDNFTCRALVSRCTPSPKDMGASADSDAQVYIDSCSSRLLATGSSVRAHRKRSLKRASHRVGGGAMMGYDDG